MQCKYLWGMQCNGVTHDEMSLHLWPAHMLAVKAWTSRLRLHHEMPSPLHTIQVRRHHNGKRSCAHPARNSETADEFHKLPKEEFVAVTTSEEADGSSDNRWSLPLGKRSTVQPEHDPEAEEHAHWPEVRGGDYYKDVRVTYYSSSGCICVLVT